MLRIGVLRGGNKHVQKSLKNGGDILRHLAHHHVQDIYVDKEGVWHIQGAPVSPHQAVANLDLVYNALFSFHPEIHSVLELHDIPHTSPAGISMATLHHRLLAKKAFVAHDIKTPLYKEIDTDTDVIGLFRSFPMPAVVKYFDRPDVDTVYTIADLERVVGKESAIIEEYIPGIKVHVATIKDFRDQSLYVLPPVEVHSTHHTVPSNLAHNIKETLMSYARKIHDIFSLKNHSATDFVVHPKRGIYLIRVHTTPDISHGSALHAALESVGSSIPEFVDHIVRIHVK